MCCCDVEGLILRIEQSGTKAHLFMPCYALDLIERLLKAETHPVWLFIYALQLLQDNHCIRKVYRRI